MQNMLNIILCNLACLEYGSIDWTTDIASIQPMLEWIHTL